MLLLSACAAPDPDPDPDAGEQPIPEDVMERLRALALPEQPTLPPDPTNAFADDQAAALFGQRLFFDKRFSGPLLDDANTGDSTTLGIQGRTGRVSCAGCHIPAAGFVDTRSTSRQITLASGWSRRRTPSLLDFGQRQILMWDGRRDTAYNQIFGVIESPLEFNSSLVFFAQQIAANHRAEYETLFGALPSLDEYPPIAAADAGCAEEPADPVTERCHKPGDDDEAIVQIVVNAGKAIGAYERVLTCGAGPFDAWARGDSSALTSQEQRGAVLFIRGGCDRCHSGSYLTDENFHNVGAGNTEVTFIEPYDDPGAAVGLAQMLADPLNSRGVFSDGDDGRLDALPFDLESLRGAFRTPSLRCVALRPSFMHAGQLRSLEAAVSQMSEGPDPLGQGYQGTPDPNIVPLGWSLEERDAVVAFLRTLTGPGPEAQLLKAPE